MNINDHDQLSSHLHWFKMGKRDVDLELYQEMLEYVLENKEDIEILQVQLDVLENENSILQDEVYDLEEKIKDLEESIEELNSNNVYPDIV